MLRLDIKCSVNSHGDENNFLFLGCDGLGGSVFVGGMGTVRTLAMEVLSTLVRTEECSHRAWGKHRHGEQQICRQFEDGRIILKLLKNILFEQDQKDDGWKVRWRAVALGRHGTNMYKGPLD